MNQKTSSVFKFPFKREGFVSSSQAAAARGFDDQINNTNYFLVFYGSRNRDIWKISYVFVPGDIVMIKKKTDFRKNKTKSQAILQNISDLDEYFSSVNNSVYKLKCCRQPNQNQRTRQKHKQAKIFADNCDNNPEKHWKRVKSCWLCEHRVSYHKRAVNALLWDEEKKNMKSETQNNPLKLMSVHLRSRWACSFNGVASQQLPESAPD